MKLFGLIFALVLTASYSFAGEYVATLSAKFRGTSAATGHVYTVSQAENSQWQIDEFKGCPSYPCYEKDVTDTSLVTPKLLTPPHMADGNPKVQLGKNLTLEFINMWGAGSYYELQLLNADGTLKEKIKLTFYPVFENKELKP